MGGLGGLRAHAESGPSGHTFGAFRRTHGLHYLLSDLRCLPGQGHVMPGVVRMQQAGAVGCPGPEQVRA